jgi:hypothetical protein
MEKTLHVSEDGAAATVTVTVAFRGNNPKKEGCTTDDVLAFLAEKGYTVIDVVQGAHVSNCAPEKCSGTWVLLLKQPMKKINVVVAPPIEIDLRKPAKKVRALD